MNLWLAYCKDLRAQFKSLSLFHVFHIGRFQGAHRSEICGFCKSVALDSANLQSQDSEDSSEKRTTNHRTRHPIDTKPDDIVKRRAVDNEAWRTKRQSIERRVRTKEQHGRDKTKLITVCSKNEAGREVKSDRKHEKHFVRIERGVCVSDHHV